MGRGYELSLALLSKTRRLGEGCYGLHNRRLFAAARICKQSRQQSNMALHVNRGHNALVDSRSKNILHSLIPKILSAALGVAVGVAETNCGGLFLL